MADVGNLPTIATTSEEMFGQAAYVAAGLFGDGLWTDMGLVMRVSIKTEIFNQNLTNEVMQVAKDSVFQTNQSGTCTLMLRRYNEEQIKRLFPTLVKSFDAGTGTNGGHGWDVTPAHVNPIGLHIRPANAHKADDNSNQCWWIPVAIAQDIGEWIYKIENTDSSNEDFSLTFRFGRLEEDYTPGTPQAINSAGRMLYKGDTRSIVTNSWETGLPFGYRKGYAGRVESFGVKTTASTSLTVEWTAPDSEFIDSPITGYTVWHRTSGSTSAFTKLEVNVASTTERAISSLTSGVEYEIRVAPKTAEGTGQQAVLFASTS